MKDFQGASILKKFYDDAIEHLSEMYNDGRSFCLAGNHGIGKSMTLTNILKKACQKGYSSLYTTLNDMVNTLINAPYEEKYTATKELMLVDFLIIDELDARYIADGSADLIGRQVEHILRNRISNKLPTLYATNSPAPLEAFKGSLKISMESLFNRVKIIPVLAADFRKMQK